MTDIGIPFICEYGIITVPFDLKELAAEEATQKVSTKPKEGKSLRKSRGRTQEQRTSVRGEVGGKYCVRLTTW